MAKAIRVGEEVQLPSGLTVKITAAAVKTRPWAAVEVSYLWQVCRHHEDPATPLVQHFFHPTRRHPLQLDEADAKALAAALNQAR
jgi:hypothetical protein